MCLDKPNTKIIELQRLEYLQEGINTINHIVPKCNYLHHLEKSNCKSIRTAQVLYLAIFCHGFIGQAQTTGQ